MKQVPTAPCMERLPAAARRVRDTCMDHPASSDRYQAPMDVVWQFDYEIDIAKLRDLYSKAKRLQWDAEQQIDWAQEIDPSQPLIDDARSAVMQIPDDAPHRHCAAA